MHFYDDEEEQDDDPPDTLSYALPSSTQYCSSAWATSVTRTKPCRVSLKWLL